MVVAVAHVKLMGGEVRKCELHVTHQSGVKGKEVQLPWTMKYRKNAVTSRERRGWPGRDAQPLTLIPEPFEFFAWETGCLSPFLSLLLSTFLFISFIFLFLYF